MTRRPQPDRHLSGLEEARTANTGFASGGLMCELGALCFYSTAVLIENLCFETRPSQSPNRWASCEEYPI